MTDINLTGYGTGMLQQAQKQAMMNRGQQALQTTSAAQGMGGDAKSMQTMRKSAEDFEAFFIGQMFEHMWSGVEVNETFGGGHAEQVWRSMMNQEYGKAMAAQGGIGLADIVVNQMLKMQEAVSTTAEQTSL